VIPYDTVRAARLREIATETGMRIRVVTALNSSDAKRISKEEIYE
jgi:hypothetical protein